MLCLFVLAWAVITNSIVAANTVRMLALTLYGVVGYCCYAIISRWVRLPANKRRLLYRHVLKVTLFSIFTLIAFSAEAIDKLGHPFVWYLTPLAMVASLVLLDALRDMAEWLDLRTPKERQ